VWVLIHECATTTDPAIAGSLRCVVMNNLARIMGTVVVLFAALLVNRRAHFAIERIVNPDGDRRELARLLLRMLRIGVWIAAAVVVLGLFKQTQIVASFVASLGIVGLILAFALQDITKNFAAGVLLLLLRPFRLDDRIKIRDYEGQVTDVSLRATTLHTADGVEVLVPNADVYASPITNLTRYRKRRYQLTLTLPLPTPLEQARKEIEHILRALPTIEQQPAPHVVATALTNDGVTLEARFWLSATTPDAAQRVSEVIEALRPIMEQATQAAKEEVAPAS
jgi:small conductance mechanosensitive channel